MCVFVCVCVCVCVRACVHVCVCTTRPSLKNHPFVWSRKIEAVFVAYTYMYEVMPGSGLVSEVSEARNVHT